MNQAQPMILFSKQDMPMLLAQTLLKYYKYRGTSISDKII